MLKQNKMLNLFKLSQKKGRSLLLLPFFVFTLSCSHDFSQDGRVTLHDASDKNAFSFSVSDNFVRDNAKSPKDKKEPRMTQAEVKLLYNILKQQKYCLDGYGTPIFVITSRQEKIYDMTFAHLIEQNYNARPVTPHMYFGECVKK
jgi:hypothetical protein